jgi:hypothetical protein
MPEYIYFDGLNKDTSDNTLTAIEWLVKNKLWTTGTEIKPVSFFNDIYWISSENKISCEKVDANKILVYLSKDTSRWKKENLQEFDGNGRGGGFVYAKTSIYESEVPDNGVYIEKTVNDEISILKF